MGSSYADESSSSPKSKLDSSGTSSDQSLNGLKFGQKVYFEDVGVGAQAKTGGGSAASASNWNPTKKVKAGSVQGARPPRCLVEGCEVDLSDAKPYYSRHKVCVMHSKWPTVVVAGLEQRFCQQCSRFHQLPEFDQGKRSCRRRLAGHNERRRKPPPGILTNYRHENHGRAGAGGLLMDFTAYPKLTARDAWPSTRSSQQVFGNQTCSNPEKTRPCSWQSNLRSPPSDLFTQVSMAGISLHGQRMPPGECFTGVTDSTCALSLLSNQQWGSTNRALSNNGANSFASFEGAPIAQLTTTAAPHGAAIHQIPNNQWGFKVTEVGGSSHENLTDTGLTQIYLPFGIQRSDDFELSRTSTRQLLEIEHLKAYQSPQQMHWSL